MRAILSLQAGTATEWEGAFCCWSWWRAGNPTPLTVLSAGGAPREPMVNAEVFVHPDYSGADGGHYSPFNRLFGLRDYLTATPQLPSDETLLLMDPDFAILDVVPDHPPAANEAVVAWYRTDAETRDRFVRRLSRHPECLQHIGIAVPAWVRRADLEAWLPDWIEQTHALRVSGLPTFSWVAEMVAFWLALSDTCAAVRLVPEACGPHLVHYVFGSCGLRFVKYRYHPWDAVAAASADASPLAAQLTALLSEYAALRRLPG